MNVTVLGEFREVLGKTLVSRETMGLIHMAQLSLMSSAFPLPVNSLTSQNATLIYGQ